MALPAFTGLGPIMSVDDPVYVKSAGHAAGFSGMGPDCECPGFDAEMLPNKDALLGRWVRSPSKFVGWDTYMEFFGLSGDKALQETEEPQEHVIVDFSKDKLRLIHRLCWRDGLDCEYTVPLDGSVQPIPPAMVAKASSSWKVNDLATWAHAWDEGDGNPLHRGLRTEQKLAIAGVNYTLRYWRSLIRPNEMRVNVEVTYADTGKYAVHTQRFFRKIDVDQVYAIAGISPSVLPEVGIPAAAVWTHNGRNVRLAIMPHASNMKAGWQKLDAAARWEMAEPFPSCGRGSGPYLAAVRLAARESGLWVCCGVTLRSSDEADGAKQLLRCVALIGSDGWLHGIHADASPKAAEIYSSGAGEWPATQRARPTGVYDTELGRIAVHANKPDEKGLISFAEMGAELVLVPQEEDTFTDSRVSVAIRVSVPHANLTSYTLCGPDALPSKAGEERLQPAFVYGDNGGLSLAPSLKFQPPQRAA